MLDGYCRIWSDEVELLSSFDFATGSGGSIVDCERMAGHGGVPVSLELVTVAQAAAHETQPSACFGGLYYTYCTLSISRWIAHLQDTNVSSVAMQHLAKQIEDCPVEVPGILPYSTVPIRSDVA
jgi:hypothetical protein